jgi:hypothetical protein
MLRSVVIVLCGCLMFVAVYARAQKQQDTSTEMSESSSQGMATAQLVGIVYDKDSRPGDQVTLSVTTDPKKYEGIPALGVIEVEIPHPAGVSQQDVLQGMMVEVGDGRKQPANQPLTCRLGQNATKIPVVISPTGNATVGTQISVPLAQGPPQAAVINTGRASDFTTPPVVQNVSVINGPLSGDAGLMHIAVSNQPATIVAATPRSVLFDLPRNISPGPQSLTLQDGERNASAAIVRIGLVLKADQLKLERGQSTRYSATVQLGPLPDSVWQHGGSSPELVSTAQAGKSVSGFHPPQAGQPAAVFFHLVNLSRQAVTIEPSQNEAVTRVLHQQDFQENQFIEAGVIRAIKSGGFNIKVTVEAYFAPISFNESSRAVGEERSIATEPNPFARQLPKDVQGCHRGYCKKIEKQNPDYSQVIDVYCAPDTPPCPKPCSCALFKAKSNDSNDSWKRVPGDKESKEDGFDYKCFCIQ